MYRRIYNNIENIRKLLNLKKTFASIENQLKHIETYRKNWKKCTNRLLITPWHGSSTTLKR